MVWLDHAYVEFADEDLTSLALELGNVLVFRTLSKAWGLAGLRTGYVVGPAEVVSWMRRVGLPYPVSGPSVAVAVDRLNQADADVADFIASIRSRRAELAAALLPCAASVPDSQANFVFARFDTPEEASRVRDGLAHAGIAVRGWPGRPDLQTGLRITVASTDADHQRLLHALRAVLKEAP